jgi:hypothetical protein
MGHSTQGCCRDPEVLPIQGPHVDGTAVSRIVSRTLIQVKSSQVKSPWQLVNPDHGASCVEWGGWGVHTKAQRTWKPEA